MKATKATVYLVCERNVQACRNFVACMVRVKFVVAATALAAAAAATAGRVVRRTDGCGECSTAGWACSATAAVGSA